MLRQPNPADAIPAPQKTAPEGYDSVARLMHLARVADMQAAAARDLQGRRNDVASEIARLRREQEPFAQGIHRDPTRHAALGAEIASLEAQRGQLDADQRQAANAAVDALRLHETCSLFAYENGLPRPSILSSGAAAPAGAFQ